MTQTLPTAEHLTYQQHQGWAPVWCGRSLRESPGGENAGRAQGEMGFSLEVYACPPGRGCRQRGK